MFNTFPPTIQEYLPVEEDLALYVEDSNNIYDSYILGSAYIVIYTIDCLFHVR